MPEDLRIQSRVIPEDLRIQSRVILATFVVAALAASALASHGSHLVEWRKETFSPLPSAPADAREREAAYGAWIEAPDDKPEVVTRLVRADASILARAERTIAVGSSAQRQRAVRFLLLAGPDARPALRRAHDWLARLGDGALCVEIKRVIPKPRVGKDGSR